MCQNVCPGGKSMTDDWPQVSIEWEVEFTGGTFATARTIKKREDADKAVNDYLLAILPVVFVSVKENGETKYKYTLDPKDYSVQMVRLMKHQVLREVKDCIGRLQYFIETEEEE